MPEYTPIVLLVFVLVTCVHKRHVQDWRLFRYGCYALLVSMALVVLSEILRNRFLFNWVGYVMYAGPKVAQLVAAVLLVLGCLIRAEPNSELRCPGCQYRLKGLSEPRCPECGFTI